MTARTGIVASIFLVVALASGCGKSDSSGNGKQAGSGYVNAGGSLEVNILVVKFKLWFTVRDVDHLVVNAFDWATRQVRYLVNGQEKTLTLNEEQATKLKQEVDAQTTAPK
jgi:hypothetical protein